MGGDDLLGGGGGGDETAQFEQQFPDLSGPNEVRVLPEPSCPSPLPLATDEGIPITDGDLALYFLNILTSTLLHRRSHPAVTSPALARP